MGHFQIPTRWSLMVFGVAALAVAAAGCGEEKQSRPAAEAVAAAPAEGTPDEGAAPATPKKAEAAPEAAKPAATPAPEAKEKPPAKAEVRSPPKKAAPARRATKEVDWSASPIAWVGWDEGVAAAKADNKPILLFVYADW